RSLRAAGARVTLATHDAALRDGLLAELGPMDVEMLLGVRPEDHGPLRARGVTPRLYVPYGRDWFRYWMRRVAESQGAGRSDRSNVGEPLDCVLVVPADGG